MNNTYTSPVLQKIGSFDDLTRCVWWGSCRDFLGCGLAPICF